MKSNGQLFKGSLTTIIIKLLSEQDRMYGYEITQKVKALTEGKLILTEGALYPALHKLESEGLLDVSLEYAGNRPRKYYSLTRKGRKEVSNKLEEVKEFIRQMESLLHLKPGFNA